jgi:beta-N-acetylhexosaminidase
MTPSGRAKNKSRTKTRRQPGDHNWVEKTLKRMTLREKIGQLLMVPFVGLFTSSENADYKEALRQVEENHVGGLMVATTRGPLGIKRSQVYPTAVMPNEFQRRAKIPLLIGADFESGTAMRLDEGTSFPSAMAIGATGDPKLAYAAGKTIALESRAAGVHWIFAPDADVNNNPDNPIINIRSFGEDPKSVAQFATEFIRGVEEHGALATAKHFPGHGNVSVDSHLSMPAVPGSHAELDKTELIPFRAAIAAGLSSIMTGHLSVPALESDPNVPATLSRNVLTRLLRDELKFRGLIVTDAMDMGGITSLYTPGEAAVRAIEAGVDVVLLSANPDAAIAALEAAVKSGRISAERIDVSVRRILATKSRLRLDKNRLVDIARLNESFGSPECATQALDIATRGITLLRNDSKMLPLDATRPLRVLLASLSADPDPYPGETIELEIPARVDSLQALRADTRFANVSTLTLPPPETYDIAIAALFVRVADGKGNVGFPDDQRAFVNQLLAGGKPVVIAAFGTPYLISQFPNAKTWLAAFSTNRVAQHAAARALFGESAIAGAIPVTVPGIAKRGDGLHVPGDRMTLRRAPASFSARLKPAYKLLDRAVSDGAFPGGILAVGWKNQLAIHPFGKFSRDKKASAVTVDTIYDVASLTKAIVTTTAIMKLVERKQLDLDAPVSRYLTEWITAEKSDPDAGWRSRVTVRMLLLHDSGLPAHEDFFKLAKGHDAMLARVMAQPLIREPGTKIEYSDLGFILLGEIVSRVTGTSLDAFAQREIFSPLGMHNSRFNPPRSLRARIAPTEHDAAFRKRLIVGEVHDENAWAMGGVSGHAGLFSTAGDIAIFAQTLLNGGVYAHKRLLARATIQTFTARQNIGDSTRALGWDVPVAPSTSGHYFSPSGFGHLGFTGTSLWIDPERSLFVILLTNRVNPTRANIKIREVWPALHDAIGDALAKP